MREVTEQQTEVRNVGLVLAEALARVSQNSQRICGWTPREMSKITVAVDSLVENLGFCREEQEKVWASRTRWSLIDKANSLLKETSQEGKVGNFVKAEVRTKFDNEWKTKDIVV